jgi:hypothetical protein
VTATVAATANYSLASASQTITIAPSCTPPQAFTLSAPNGLNICTNNSILVAPSGYSTYTWSDGELNASTIWPSQKGQYTVTVTNACGSYTSPAVTVTRVPSGCALTRMANPPMLSPQNQDVDPPTVTELSAYPNPASDLVTVAMPLRMSKDTPVFIYDFLGNPLVQSNLKTGEWKTEISITNIADGLYVIKVGNTGVINVTKLVVMRN